MLRLARDRFDKILFTMLAVFCPNEFAELVKRFKTARYLLRLQPLKQFCDKYNLDYIRCADELFSFSRVYSRFDSSIFYSEVDQDEKMQDENEINCEVDDDITIAIAKQHTGIESGQNREKNPHFSALAISCSPVYHLMYAYPLLCKVCSIAVAIAISSFTAEQSFSALKRIKTRYCRTG